MQVVDLLDVDMSKAENCSENPEGELSLDMKVARGGTYALWSLCRSKQNRLLIKVMQTSCFSVRSLCRAYSQ